MMAGVMSLSMMKYGVEDGNGANDADVDECDLKMTVLML